jgi:hypothetical protein
MAAHYAWLHTILTRHNRRNRVERDEVCAVMAPGTTWEDDNGCVLPYMHKGPHQWREDGKPERS